jgi:hypothetical protein
MKNIWVGVKNKKQMIFLNQHLDKGSDPSSDSAGIIDLRVNQKSEELYTLSKDLSTIRTWTYEMVIRNPRKVKHLKTVNKGVLFDVIVSNRKNIYFNFPIFSFHVIDEMDLIAVCT